MGTGLVEGREAEGPSNAGECMDDLGQQAEGYGEGKNVRQGNACQSSCDPTATDGAKD